MRSLFLVFVAGVSAAQSSLLQRFRKQKAAVSMVYPPIPVGNAVFFGKTEVDHRLDECIEIDPAKTKSLENGEPIMVKGTSIRVEAFIYKECQSSTNVPAAVPFHLGACDTKKSPEFTEVRSANDTEAPAGLVNYLSYRVVKC